VQVSGLKQASSTLWRLAVTAALCSALAGSVCIANAFTQAHTANLAPVAFPAELPGCIPDNSRLSVNKSDMVMRPVMASGGQKLLVLVRRNAASGVLHDLTSCLIDADAKPAILGIETIDTGKTRLRGCLVSYQIKTRPGLALLWFQKGSQTATDRWSWRWLSTFSNELRNAPAYYQAEVSLCAGKDRASDLRALKDVSKQVFLLLAGN